MLFQDAGRKTTPSNGSPVVTKRQSAMISLRASATTMVLRVPLRLSAVRALRRYRRARGGSSTGSLRRVVHVPFARSERRGASRCEMKFRTDGVGHGAIIDRATGAVAAVEVVAITRAPKTRAIGAASF
jgi:hypothetical protein